MLGVSSQEELNNREAELLEVSQQAKASQADATEALSRVVQLQNQLRQMEATLLEDSGAAKDSEEKMEQVCASDKKCRPGCCRDADDDRDRIDMTRSSTPSVTFSHLTCASSYPTLAQCAPCLIKNGWLHSKRTLAAFAAVSGYGI